MQSVISSGVMAWTSEPHARHWMAALQPHQYQTGRRHPRRTRRLTQPGKRRPARLSTDAKPIYGHLQGRRRWTTCVTVAYPMTPYGAPGWATTRALSMHAAVAG